MATRAGSDTQSQPETPEHTAFRRCYEDLVNHLGHNPETTCDSLITKGYIPDDVRDYARLGTIPGPDKARKMLDAIMDLIKQDSGVFEGFIEVLNANKYSESTAQKMLTIAKEEREKQQAENKSHFSGEFPYLDVKGLPEYERYALERKLIKDTREMERSFNKFTKSVQRSLDANSSVSLGDVKGALLGIGVIQEVDKKEIKEESSFLNIMNILRAKNYITFLHYYIVENLVKELGSVEDHKMLDAYLEELEKFCERSVFQVPKSAFDCKARNGEKIIAFKFIEQAMSVNKVREVTRELADVFLNVKLSDFQICTIKEGCFELHFLVSAAVAKQALLVTPSKQLVLSKISAKIISYESKSIEDTLEVTALAAGEGSLEAMSEMRDSTTDSLSVQQASLKKSSLVNCTINKLINYDDCWQSFDEKDHGICDDGGTRDGGVCDDGAFDEAIWTTSEGKVPYSALGTRSVVLIAPDVDFSNPEVVARRPRSELTEDERQKLERRGIAREHHHSDLAIMRARHGLDKRTKTIDELTGTVTCDQVIKKITALMATTDKAGVALFYFGPGRRGTGDWCFNDGFITLEQIMELYKQEFRGKILVIVMDSSYSGCWVKQAMVFMDCHGVGPCGHSAKEKQFPIKVFSSCQPNEISAELAFSVNTAKNDKNTGLLTWRVEGLKREPIHDGQHPCGMDFTQVYCNASTIDHPCTMAPGSTWEQWRRGQRIFLVRGEDECQPSWYYVLLEDDEDIKLFEEKVASGRIDLADSGQVLNSGCGRDPPDDVRDSITNRYRIDYNYQLSDN